MQNYIDYRIENKVSRQFRRVAEGRTDIVPLDNGEEIRNARWKHKRMKYSANFAQLDRVAQEKLMGAFYACNSMLLLFRFRDDGDYQVRESPLVGVVAGQQTPIQLTKRYSFGPAHADRMIQAVSTCVVTGPDGVVNGTFDPVLGLFSPAAPWAAGTHTWSGTFDVWVRFGSDEFDSTMVNFDIATSDVELVERRARR